MRGSTDVNRNAIRSSTAAACPDTDRATATSCRNEVHGVPPRSSPGQRGTCAASSLSTRASAANCRAASAVESDNAAKPARNAGRSHGVHASNAATSSA